MPNILSYNTERGPLYIPEYGRNVQKMINYAKRLESKEERNLAAHAIIDVMGQLNPQLRDVEDYTHKLWTHLFVMSNFEIDVDSPYEIPKQETLRERPRSMPYPRNDIKFGHYGHYAEEMIRNAGKVEDEEEKNFLADTLGNLLKKNYLTFHTHNVENKSIANDMERISNRTLKLKNTDVLASSSSILKEVGISVAKGKGSSKKKRSNKRKRR